MARAPDATPLSASDFELRPMEPDDLDQVLALENEIFIDPWIRDSFEAEISSEEGVHWARTAWRGERLAGSLWVPGRGGAGWRGQVS